MHLTRVLAVLLAAAGVCSLVAPALVSGSAGATTVGVTMTDFKFKLSRSTLPRGVVTFKVINRGDTAHDFKIMGKKTPIYAPGTGGALRVTFRKPGRYAFICAVPGHTSLGMKGVLRIT